MVWLLLHDHNFKWCGYDRMTTMLHGVAMTAWPQCYMVWLWLHDHNVTWCSVAMTAMSYGDTHMTVLPQCHMVTWLWLYDTKSLVTRLWPLDMSTCRRLYAYYYKVTCSQGQCNLVCDFCDKINFVTGPWLRHVCNCDTVLWSHGLFLPLVSKPPPLPPNPFWSMKIVKGYLHHFLLP